MREFINITESYLAPTWSKDTLNSIDDNMFSRFQNKGCEHIGQISDNDGSTYQIWSNTWEGQFLTFYAVTEEGRPVGYVHLIQVKDKYYKISVVYVSRTFGKQGIAKALYKYVLSRGIFVVSDAELTKGSKAIWQSFINDPNYTVKLIKDIPRNPAEKDDPLNIVELKNINQAFKNPHDRLVLFPKNALTEATEAFSIPKVWYHSTELDPEVVAADFKNNNVDPTGAVKDEQYWFSDSWEASRYYGENTVVATLSFHNPLLVTSEEYAAKKPHGPTSHAAMAKRMGYDAVVIHDICDGDMFSTVCAVFNPSLIHARAYSRWNEETQDFDLL
jgi:hypothetical protein